MADQKANGIDILTDGKFGRSMWHLDFVWGLKGIERYIAEHGYTFKDHDGGQYETRKDIGIRITEPLSGKNHHYLDIYKLVKAEAGDEDTKQTIWGPAHAYTELAIFDRLAGPGPVSYTHLDVYKRQYQHRPLQKLQSLALHLFPTNVRYHWFALQGKNRCV